VLEVRTILENVQHVQQGLTGVLLPYGEHVNAMLVGQGFQGDERRQRSETL
jgi:hypothetical protein